MKGYAIIGKDGKFIEGRLPDGLDKDKFCIMCAAAFGSGYTAQREIEDTTFKVVIEGGKDNIIIREIDQKKLVVIIGNEEDLEKFMKGEYI